MPFPEFPQTDALLEELLKLKEADKLLCDLWMEVSNKTPISAELHSRLQDYFGIDDSE